MKLIIFRATGEVRNATKGESFRDHAGDYAL
jgi:hypothetical protein